MNITIYRTVVTLSVNIFDYTKKKYMTYSTGGKRQQMTLNHM